MRRKSSGAEPHIVRLREQRLHAFDEFASRFRRAGLVVLDQACRVAVGAEGEIVFQEIEQPHAIVLVTPGSEAVERALPLPLVAAVLLQHLDQLGAQSVAADRNEMGVLGRRPETWFRRLLLDVTGRARG